MTSPLIEAIARALSEEDRPGSAGDFWEAYTPAAQAALKAISESGHVVVPVEAIEKFELLREECDDLLIWLGMIDPDDLIHFKPPWAEDKAKDMMSTFLPALKGATAELQRAKAMLSALPDTGESK